ncbi:MAG: GNAT family N-acetyltransferase [Flavobacteriaceae bacterium]|nr:MAG: GNAT family N-acetyltransferase [Flavobacteriaceae bacterium]
MNLRIQKCSLIHLEELIKTSRTTFVEAFEKQNNPEDFKNYIDFAFDKEKLSSELVNPNSHFYFVYDNLSLLGYFKLNEGDTQTDIKENASLELERIYVLQEFQGNKIGEWLLGQIIELGVKLDKKYIWLGVWEQNSKAITFYQRNGFSKFDTHPYYIGKDKQTDWLMRLDLK